jgi:hypothetical protein
MKRFVIATAGASALTAALVGLAAPAVAAPSANTNAQATITSLEEQGFHVVVNRLSERPLTEANVVSLGEGASVTHAVSDASGNDARQFGPVTASTVYVNVR